MQLADNFNHNINIGVGPRAAAAIVTDQVVLVVLQCSALSTEAEDSELTIVKVLHITHQDRDRATLAMCRQYEVLRTPPLLLIPSHYHVNQGLLYWTLLHP